MAKATRLITNRRIRQMERTAEAIANVIEQLPDEKYMVIELRYWTRPQLLTDYGIAQQLHVDRRTIQRWADEILYAIAIGMGLVNGVE